MRIPFSSQLLTAAGPGGVLGGGHSQVTGYSRPTGLTQEIKPKYNQQNMNATSNQRPINESEINKLKQRRSQLQKEYDRNPVGGPIAEEMSNISKLLSEYEAEQITDADRSKSVEEARNKSWNLGIFSNKGPASKGISPMKRAEQGLQSLMK